MYFCAPTMKNSKMKLRKTIPFIIPPKRVNKK
jgi:hypothetical protein